MPRYDFSELSDFEFESLCRDLLEAELGIPLELFTPGPDGGIDLRYLADDGGSGALIVQCKKWDKQAFAALQRHLANNELPKVNALKPTRYILATPVQMTPGRKDKLVKTMQPWIRSPADIYGRDDITGLLRRHPEIEKANIKLWLTSTDVLEAVIHRGIGSRSEAAIDHARRQIRLWVPNPSYSRARAMLDEESVCVVSGKPGIGKTMLAEILLADHAAEGYAAVAIASDIAEADDVWERETKQIFYYDDFLGRIRYGELHLEKNEENRIARFVERVRNDPTKRFILTTREYILQEAINQYERLDQTKTFQMIVSIDDYDELTKAKILYNHIFFSDVSRDMKTAILDKKAYWSVIKHANYNPRVIEHAVEMIDNASLSREEFVSELISALDHPALLWERVYGSLSPLARYVLLALVSLRPPVLLDDVRKATGGFVDAIDNAEFADVLKVLEGNFISISEASPGKGRSERVVQFRDPSVEDYLWDRLEQVDGEVEAIVAGASFFEQIETLWRAATGGHRFGGRASSLDLDSEAVGGVALRLIAATSARLDHYDDLDLYRRRGVDLEERAQLIVALAAPIAGATKLGDPQVERICEVVKAHWATGSGNPRSAFEFLRKVSGTGELPRSEVLNLAKALIDRLDSRLDLIEEFQALRDIETIFPELFEVRPLTDRAEDFEQALRDEISYLTGDSEDPGEILDSVTMLSALGGEFGVDTDWLDAEVQDRVDELESRGEREYERDDDRSFRSPDGGTSSEIDALFDSLRFA